MKPNARRVANARSSKWTVLPTTARTMKRVSGSAGWGASTRLKKGTFFHNCLRIPLNSGQKKWRPRSHLCSIEVQSSRKWYHQYPWEPPAAQEMGGFYPTALSCLALEAPKFSPQCGKIVLGPKLISWSGNCRPWSLEGRNLSGVELCSPSCYH